MKMVGLIFYYYSRQVFDPMIVIEVSTTEEGMDKAIIMEALHVIEVSTIGVDMDNTIIMEALHVKCCIDLHCHLQGNAWSREFECIEVMLYYD